MKIGFLLKSLFLVFPFYSIAYATTEEEIIEDITSCDNPEYEIKTLIFYDEISTAQSISIKHFETRGYSEKINANKDKKKIKKILQDSNLRLENNKNKLSHNPSNIRNGLSVTCAGKSYLMYFSYSPNHIINGDSVSSGIVFANKKYYNFYNYEWINLAILNLAQELFTPRKKDIINYYYETDPNKDFIETHYRNSTNKSYVNQSCWSDLRIWQDADSDAVADEGELKTLDDLGIASIDLNASEVSETDANRNQISHRGEVSWANGSTTEAEDVWFQINITLTRYQGDVEIPDDIAALPEVQIPPPSHQYYQRIL